MATTMVERVTEPGQPAWRTDRRPVIIAVAVVAAIVAGCWLLRWWGPINPSVSVVPAGTGPAFDHVTLVVANDSLAAVEVVGVSGPTWSSEVVPTPTADEQRAAGVSVVGGFPVVPGRSAVELRIEPPMCRPGWPGTTGSQWYVVDVRTATGRVLSLSTKTDDGVSCRPYVPQPGAQPADPTAREQVVEAFTLVYAPASEAGLAHIDDPRGIPETYEAAQAGKYGPLLDLLSVTVDEVVFDRPDHAWVRYRFPSPAVSERWGEAVLVDGTWKVTRPTVCQDFTLMLVTCPPA